MEKVIQILLIPLLLPLCLVGCMTEGRVPSHGVAGQERGDQPLWREGDYWKYRLFDGRRWSEKVVGVERDAYIVAYGNEKAAIDRRTLQFKMWLDASGRKIPSLSGGGPLFFDFPLYVGKKWGKMVEGKLFDGAPFDYLFSFRVLALEEITVKAGTFRAFKIEQVQSDLQMGATATTYLWFSSEVKNVIKSQFVGSWGDWNIKGQDFELVEFKLAEN